MLDELNIDNEMICQILHEDLWNRNICIKFITHTHTHRQAEARKTHIMPRLCPGLSRQSQFTWLHFLFPKVKTDLKGKRFQDVEDIGRNMTAKLKLFFWRPLLTFKQFFKQFNKCI
jgi:hypothetical protein